MKYLFFILLSPILLFAKDPIVKEISEQDIQKKRCLSSFIKNPLISRYYNDLTSDIAFPFLKEMDDYCSCLVNELQSEYKDQASDWIAYSFKRKNILFEKRDFCAQDKFSKHHIQIYYETQFYSLFKPYLSNKIEEVIPNGHKIIVGVDKWNNYKNCISLDIGTQCSKIKSLNLTYSCIKRSFNDYDPYHRKCLFNFNEGSDIIINKDEII